ncbi:hypothetical protein C8C98_3165 [Acidovorax sp. 106]|nr:hypothetical protein C8C98_3165 [Acidovorax sp. 106]
MVKAQGRARSGSPPGGETGTSPLRPGWAIIIGFAGIILRLKELNNGIR